MELTNIAREMALLPREAQREVMDFVELVKARYLAKECAGSDTQTNLTDEPFVGMWRDRWDLQDSTGWVRRIRRKEWERVG